MALEVRTFTCDVCGKPATEWVRIYRHDLMRGMRQGAHDLREWDLCSECSSRLFDWTEVRKDGKQGVDL